MLRLEYLHQINRLISQVCVSPSAQSVDAAVLTANTIAEVMCNAAVTSHDCALPLL